MLRLRPLSSGCLCVDVMFYLLVSPQVHGLCSQHLVTTGYSMECSDWTDALLTTLPAGGSKHLWLFVPQLYVGAKIQ